MTEVIANIVGITIFVLVIAFSIAFHEWGHFVTARRFGAKVTEFMVGFGPRIWSRRRGETEYGLKAIPVGGYVRIIGMIPPGKDAPEGMIPDSSTGRFATVIEQARAESMIEIGPEDADRVFYKLPPWQRIIVMMAGPVMNLVLAAVLFTVLLVGIGTPQVNTTVREIVPCVPTAAEPFGRADDSGACASGSAPSPASSADIRPGDVLVALNGAPVATWEEFSAGLAEQRPGDTAAVGLQREGAELVTTITLAEAVFPVVDEDGELTEQTQTRAFVGIRPDAAYVPSSITAVPAFMWDLTKRSAEALVALPARLVELTGTLISGGERDPNGPVGVVGISRIGGEVAALDEPLKAKVGTFLGLAASLNLFLFLFNLLPLLPLDGGHVAAAAYESVRRRLARLRGMADPGPVDVARLLPVTYAVASVLLVAGVIVIWADLVKPITLTG